MGFNSERRAVMGDLEGGSDIVRLAVLIDCSGHWRGSIEGRKVLWPRPERTRPELDKGWGTRTQLPNVLLNAGLSSVTVACDTKLSPKRGVAVGLLPFVPTSTSPA